MLSVVVQNFIAKHKSAIDDAIDLELGERKNEIANISPLLDPVISAMTELAAGGKRLRGLLVILGYQLSGGTLSEDIYKAAAVMELFHLGLLIQDDVMDRDKLRRGVKTIHSRYIDSHLGESIAVCAGDLPFGWGMEILAGLEIAPAKINNALKVWGKYFGRVGYGQILDVFGEQRGDTGAKEILQVLMIKSGEYTCVLPLLLGAALAGGDAKTTENLRQYGMELGWVFQLRDDWLSEYGDSTITGKPTGNDAREGRKSYAVMYGKGATEAAIMEHLELGKKYANSDEVLNGLLNWIATREY